MVTKEQIDKINQLSKKSKAEGLTEGEKQEQAELRQQYVASFRTNLKSQLDNIRFVDNVEDTSEEAVENPKKLN